MADDTTDPQGIINIYNRLVSYLLAFEAEEGYSSAEQFRANTFTEGSRYAPKIELDYLIAASTGKTDDHARGKVLVARVRKHVEELGFKDGKIISKQPLKEITFAQFNALPLLEAEVAAVTIAVPAQPNGPVKPPPKRDITG